MDQGKAAEYDTPRVLIDREAGIFKSLVESSGEKDVLREVILGEE
jgi:ABC-type multidrug transport system fused ATPase/permease subunit